MGLFICIGLSLVASFLIALAGTIAAAFVTGNAETAAELMTNSPFLYGAILLADLVINLAGGFTIARMAKGAEVRHAAVVAITGFVLGALLVWWHPPQNTVENVSNYIGLVLTFVPIAAAHYKAKQH